MATIANIERMKTLFEQGRHPKEVAKLMNENPYRVSSLARLLGFAFGQVSRNPMDWYSIESNQRKRIFFNCDAIDLKDMKSYRVSSVDEKGKKIVIEFK